MRKLFAFIMAVTLLSSCKKDDDNETQTAYLPLRIGNYWIYQNFRIDTSGNETAVSKPDSVIIKRDTIINKKKYYVLEGIYFPVTYGDRWGIVDILRDSSGYIVNQNGFVKFAENNFTDTIASYIITNPDNSDTLVMESYKMERTDNAISVPAGIFEVLNYKGTVTTTMTAPRVKYPRYTNTYYTKGVGKILHTYFYIAAPDIYENRLVRYHVKE